MSRSRKKAIIKDRPRNVNAAAFYWRRVRSAIKNAIRSCRDLENLEVPDPKNIVNDYDYCDYIIDYEHDYKPTRWWTLVDILEYRTKYRRK